MRLHSLTPSVLVFLAKLGSGFFWTQVQQGGDLRAEKESAPEKLKHGKRNVSCKSQPLHIDTFLRQGVSDGWPPPNLAETQKKTKKNHMIPAR